MESSLVESHQATKSGRVLERNLQVFVLQRVVRDLDDFKYCVVDIVVTKGREEAGTLNVTLI